MSCQLVEQNVSNWIPFSTVCPEDGWVSFANDSYLIIDIPTLNWVHARRICQMLGGDLAIIRSAAENAFIFKLVIKQSTVQRWGSGWDSYAKPTISFIGLMALQWQMVTRIGEAANQTAWAKSVETCLVRNVAQESGTTFLAMLFQDTWGIPQLFFARKRQTKLVSYVLNSAYKRVVIKWAFISVIRAS